MKRIRRPILVNRAPYKRIIPNVSPAQKQNSQLLSLYHELAKRVTILNQICRSLTFDLEKNTTNYSDTISKLIESINVIINSFLCDVQLKSTHEAEKLRCLLRQSNANKDLNKIISEILSIFISFTHLQPTLGIALSTDDTHHLFDIKHNPKNEHKNSALPSLYHSADSSVDDLAAYSSESSTDNFLIKSEGSDENPTVLCRICEKLIPLDLIDKHSTLCIQGHQAKYQIIKYTDKLKKFNQKLSSQLSIPLTEETKEDIPILYPLLYLYLTIDIAISFKGEEIGAISALDSALNGLNSIKIPKAAFQYACLFEHGTNLIQKKLNGLYLIEQKSLEIAKTTVDHSVVNFYKEANLSDFEFLSRLSAGAFARVYLAKKKTTGDLYAIKVIKKTFANLKNQIRTVTVERDIMMQLHSPYMVNFYYSFIKKNNLYLVMEYLPGGDIYSLLQTLGSLPEDSTRTYIIQVVKALQFLRENQIIHRDLKPDNLLVDCNGFLRLTDFGLSLIGINGLQLSTRVGTPDYMAPEIVLPQNYSFSCDYWSLGVMTYEMLYGEPPFHGETEDETFQNILIGSYDLSILEDVSDTCKDFISKLLIPNPMKRLGADRFEEVMEHPWFNGVDWNKVREMEPVFVPDNQDETQNEYFTPRYEFPDDAEDDIRQDLNESNNSESSQKVNDDENTINYSNSGNLHENDSINQQSSSSYNSTNNKNSQDSNSSTASSSNSGNSKRPPRKRSSTCNVIKKIPSSLGSPDKSLNIASQGTPDQSDLSISPSNSINRTIHEDLNVAKTDESLNFEKVSLQHLKTMNEGESEKIRRKRSSTVTGPPPPSIMITPEDPGPSSTTSNNNEEKTVEKNNGESQVFTRRQSTNSLYTNGNKRNSLTALASTEADKSSSDIKMRLEYSRYFLSSSNFSLKKGQLPFTSSPSSPSSPSLIPCPTNPTNAKPFRSNNYPSSLHSRTPASLRSGSTPLSYAKINNEGNYTSLSPLVSSTNQNINTRLSNVTRPEVKASNSFSNLNLIIPQNKINCHHRRSDSMNCLNQGLDHIEDSLIIASSSSPSKYECDQDETFTSSLNIDNSSSLTNSDLKKRFSHNNIKLPPHYQNGQ